MPNCSKQNGQGFSLIEMILSLAIFLVIAALSFPVYQSLQNRNDLKLAENLAITGLRRAQTLAIGSANDTVWGLHGEAGALTVFSGNSWSGRNSTTDETIALPGGVRVSGTAEFIFQKISGQPYATGTLILYNAFNETKSLNLNAVGSIVR